MKIDYGEVKDIARVILNLKKEHDIIDIEKSLYDTWGIDIEILEDILNRIYPLMDFSLSPLTRTAYVGLGKDENWLAKKEVNQQFITALINWCTDEKLKS